VRVCLNVDAAFVAPSPIDSISRFIIDDFEIQIHPFFLISLIYAIARIASMLVYRFTLAK
jgi:hypothetical protein